MYTYDTAVSEDIIICQPSDGYRFTSDALRLAHFAAENMQGGSVLEIGAGSGVISAVLAKYYGFRNITAVELQDKMFNCLTETVRRSEVEDNICAVHKDIKDYKPDTRFSTIICNPPYRETGSGRVTENEVLKKAKFTVSLKISDVFKFAGSYLENGGALYICYPADYLQRLITECTDYGLHGKKAQFIYSGADKGAKTVLLEYRKNAKAGLKVLSAIFEEK